MKLFKRLLLAVLIPAATVFFVGCKDTSEQTAQTTQAAYAAESAPTETSEISEISETKKLMQSLKAALEKESLSSLITYGVIDFDKNGYDELFAVFSDGSQGFCKVMFYNEELSPIFFADGFSRDGNTYFMYDDTEERLLIFSEYKHSYFLADKKVSAVYRDGKVTELFEEVLKADSPSEPLTTAETYVNSVMTSEEEYRAEYNNFLENSFSDIYYIYDGTLYCGSEPISDGENIFYEYSINTEL